MPSDTFTVVMGGPDNSGPLMHQVKPTAPLPFIPTKEVRYYFCPRLHAQMCRNDGFIITFLSGIHETNNAHSIYWLDNEIANGHPELFPATEEQIDSYLFKKDPRNHVKSKTRVEVEEELTARLAKLLSARMAAAGIQDELTQAELKGMLEADIAAELPVEVQPDPDAAKLAGTPVLSELQAKLAAIRGNGVTLAGMANSGSSAI